MSAASQDEEVLLFVNRPAQVVVMIALGVVALLALVGTVQANRDGPAVFGWVLTALLITLTVRCVKRPTLYGSDAHVTVRSVLRTRRLPRSSISSWTIEESLVAMVGLRPCSVLVVRFPDGTHENLGRFGIWSEKPEVIERLCWNLNQAERAHPDAEAG